MALAAVIEAHQFNNYTITIKYLDFRLFLYIMEDVKIKYIVI